MSENNTAIFDPRTRTFDFSISKEAVAVGAILGILVNMSALLVQLLNYIGGGIVAGFVAAYIVGGPRGWFHGIIAGVIAGLAGGFVAVLMSMILPFIQPPTLMADISGLGLIAPIFDGMGIIGSLFILLTVAAFITVDSIIGGVIGGLLRTIVDTTFGR